MKISPIRVRREFGRLTVIVAVLLSSVLVAGTLEIYVIDVDQAASTLVVSPARHTLLIDSGKNGMGDRIKAVMDQAHVTAIDHYVTTHYHEDHYGGIDDLIDLGVPVHNAYDRGDKQYLPNSKTRQVTYNDYQRAVGNTARHLMRGETIPLDDDMLVTTISSGGVVLGETPPKAANEENDMSISFLINYEGFQMFVGGDIESPTEHKIAELNLARNVHIYQANHHGSHSSSSRDFMEKLSPSLVVISNGSTLSYQHPRQVTLDTYAQLNPPPLVLQTNKYISGGSDYGNVEDELIADLPPNDDFGTIHVSANMDSRIMTVIYRNRASTIPIKVTERSASSLAIAALLPDPNGSDLQNEIVTLVNRGDSVIDLSSYQLIDASGRIWIMKGLLAPREEREIIRQGMPMSLNNDGDTIRLITATGETADEFSYQESVQGRVILGN